MQALQLLYGQQPALGGLQQRAGPVREYNRQQPYRARVVEGLHAGRVCAGAAVQAQRPRRYGAQRPRRCGRVRGTPAHAWQLGRALDRDWPQQVPV